MQDLTENMREVFARCEEMGMVLPWVACSVSPNGSVLVMRVNGDGIPADVLAEHYEGQGFLLPMTIAVIDQRNEAVRVTIGLSGEETWN